VALGIFAAGVVTTVRAIRRQGVDAQWPFRRQISATDLTV
jgi:hypothetical protein